MDQINYQGGMMPVHPQKKDGTTVPFVVTLVAALLLIAAFFLPYLSMSREYMESFGGLASLGSAAAGFDVTSISFLTMTRVILDASSAFGMADEMVITLVVLIILAVLSLFTLLFAAIKKPVAAIVFDILTFLVFLLMAFGMRESGLIGNGFNYGIGFYAYIISIIAVLACSIWLAIAKSSAKKAAYDANVYNAAYNAAYDAQYAQNPAQNPEQNPVQNPVQNPEQNPVQNPVQNSGENDEDQNS